MSFQTEIEKLARTRRAYLRFALAENSRNRPWAGSPDRRYGKVGDAQSVVPVTGTISRFGTVQRSLASFIHTLEVPNISVELFDPDHEWRALAGTDDQLTYRNVSFWLRVLDDLLAPLDERVAVAQIAKATFPAGKVTLDCQVSSGLFLGAQVPRRFITTEDFPNAPAESQGLPVPIIYGRRSNNVIPFEVVGTPSGGTSPVAGNPAAPVATPDCQPGATGGSPSGAAVKAILVGTYALGTTGDPTYLPNPCGRAPYGSVAALAAALQTAKDTETLMTNSQFVGCLGYADCQKIMDLTGPVPTDPGLLADLIGEPDMNCLAFGDCPRLSVAGISATDNVYVLAGHALKSVDEVFVLKPVAIQNFSNEGDTSATRSDKVQIRMTENVDYKQQVVDLNGHRYHLLFFKAAQTSETCEYYEVTANVQGIETNGDGSGTLIDNADDIFAHVMLNWILNSYQSSVGPYAPPGSPWYTDVSYAPGLWDAASVERAKAVAAQRVTGGYKGSGTLSDVIEAREWIRELLISYDLELLFNNNLGAAGAWSINRFNPYTDRNTIPRWDAAVDTFLKETFSAEIAVDQMVNVMPFFGGPTTARLDTSAGSAPRTSGGGWRVSGRFESAASIARFGMAISEPIYLKWTDDPTTIGDVMASYSRYLEYPPVPATFRIGFKALGGPLGSLIRLTHPDAPGGTTGWTDHVCRVIRSDLDLDRLVANVTVVSVDRLMRTWVPPVAGTEVLVFSMGGWTPMRYLNYEGQELAGKAFNPAEGRGNTAGGFYQADNGVFGCAGMITADASDDVFALYDQTFTRTVGFTGGTLTYGLGWRYDGSVFFTHRRTDNVNSLYRVTSAGAVSGTFGPLPETPYGYPYWRVVGVNPAGTVAYYGSYETIKRWDLTTNTAMADFATNSSMGFGSHLRNIFSLRDGTVVAGWFHPEKTESELVRYTAAGAVLGTKIIPGQLAWITPGLTDASVWASSKLTAYTLAVGEIRISDAAVVRTFEVAVTAENPWDWAFVVLRTPLPPAT